MFKTNQKIKAMRQELINDYLATAKEPYYRAVKTAKKIEESLKKYYLKQADGYDGQCCRWDSELRYNELLDKITQKDDTARRENFLKIFYNVCAAFDDNPDDSFVMTFQDDPDFETIVDFENHYFPKYDKTRKSVIKNCNKILENN